VNDSVNDLQTRGEGAHECSPMLEEAFALIDLDRSGILTRGELLRGCREKERVRNLMGLPRNLRADIEAKRRFEALFAKLDSDESDGVSMLEFVAHFTSTEGRAAIASLEAAPSWIGIAQTLQLDPYGPPEERWPEGRLLFNSEARFEGHTLHEWMVERNSACRELSKRLAEWKVLGDGLSQEECSLLCASSKERFGACANFPAIAVLQERKRIEVALEERVAILYRPPSAEARHTLPMPQPQAHPTSGIVI